MVWKRNMRLFWPCRCWKIINAGWLTQSVLLLTHLMYLCVTLVFHIYKCHSENYREITNAVAGVTIIVSFTQQHLARLTHAHAGALDPQQRGLAEQIHLLCPHTHMCTEHFTFCHSFSPPFLAASHKDKWWLGSRSVLNSWPHRHSSWATGSVPVLRVASGLKGALNTGSRCSAFPQ